MAFDALFEPITIGNVDVKNRIVMEPMAMAHASPGGYVNEQVLAYYAARARGGVGLIIVEVTMTNKTAAETTMLNNSNLFNMTYLPGMEQLADTIHTFGAKAFLQLSPGFGRQGSSRVFGIPLVAPSSVPCRILSQNMPKSIRRQLEQYSIEYIDGEVPRELTVDEIIDMEDQYAASVVLAREAGFDGVEIHGPHGYLIHQFLSSLSNKRDDLYGGSFENRLRFLANIITKTRTGVGADFVVGLRLSGDEHIVGGPDHDEMKEVAKTCVSLGLSYINTSSGSFEGLKWFFPDEDGVMIDEGAGFKSVVDVPVICPTGQDPVIAEQAVRDGEVDMAGLGRPLITDPEWANKVREGRPGDIRKCVRCNECLGFMTRGLMGRCVVNPESGLERYNPAYNRWAVMKAKEEEKSRKD